MNGINRSALSSEKLFWFHSSFASVVVIGAALVTSVALAGDKPDSTELPADAAAYRTSHSSKGRSSKAPSRIAIGNETTYIVEPLDADGRPDYCAALNSILGRDANPGNNFAVHLVHAFGPDSVAEDAREDYFVLLGIPALPASGEYFVRCDEMVDRWLRGASENLDADADEELRGEFLIATEQPWSASDFPMVAKWLSLNEQPLHEIASAAKCTVFYEPIVAAGTNRPALLCAPSPLSTHITDIKAALQARAMFKLNEGDIRGAWSDLVSCHGLLRQMALDPTGQYAVVARSAEVDICQAEMRLLHSARPDRKQLEEMKVQWTASLPRLALQSQTSICQRYQFLDLVCCLENHMGQGLGQLASDLPLPLDDNSIDELFADGRFDWNELMKLANEWFDRMKQISKIEDRQERQAELDRAHAEFEPSAETGISSLFVVRTDRLRSVKLAFASLRQFIDSEFTNRLEAADREAINSTFVEISFALAAFRLAHGDYPQRLDELAPEFLEVVPADLYAAHAPLKYRRVDGGYLLFSVGPNGVDEEGGFAETSPDSDDIAVVISNARATKPAEETP